MKLRILTEDVKIPSKKFMAVTLLSSGTLAWIFLSYFAFEAAFTKITNDLMWVYAGRALYMSLGAVFAVIGSTISEKVNRRKLLLAWITLGVLTTASLAVFQGTLFSILASILLGASLGLGLPSCLAYIAESTNIEERARVAGAIILETFVMVTVSVLAYNILGLGLISLLFLCVALRSSSYLALGLDSCNREEGKKNSWRTILGRRDFVLYLVPWLMFNIASGLISFVWLGLPLDTFGGVLNIGQTVHFFGAGIFGLIAGIAADRFGRKQPIIIGMVMLGVSFAFLGLFTSAFSVLIYLIISGTAWGFLIVVYTAVPGDLALTGSKEKFYALGAVIPFVTYFSISGVTDFLRVSVPAGVLSSALSIILFLSVIPILKAAETLPDTKVRERKFREHVNKVGKLVQESKKK